MTKNPSKPSDYMRARRPELFSDTVYIAEPNLTRLQLEFHLDTLTQRKEEIRFEHFCRKLAEKELCPNLLPQTGPTGGGDSKTDSETYPVATSIAERWYVGDPGRASQERWAFAFSAKKDWRSKIKSDVQKIAETDRDYKLIYFITNQPVSDRNRSIVEGELSKQWNIQIRILDRTWIVEKVIQNKRWEAVYQALDIDAPHVERKQLPGPQDAGRIIELEELDHQLENSERYEGAHYQFVEDCINTAILARGLGRSRTEIDGRFDRAERMARKSIGSKQLFEVVYNRAWTAYWWFDDFDELDRLYKIAETLALDSEWVWDLEKLVNLWQVNNASRFVYKTFQDIESWKEHTLKLRSVLLSHATDVIKPTSALWARTQLVMMDLAEAAFNRDSLPAVVSNMKAILSEAESHLDYPMAPLIQIVRDLGKVIGNEDSFDELFEIVIQLQSKRTSNAEQGSLRLERGYQKLRSDKPYEAIEQFTKAQGLLAQEEHKGEFLQSIAGAALGYEAAGLLWAARANLVFALDRVLYEFHKTDDIPPQAITLLRKLVWIELQLGRVNCVFIWIEYLNILRNVVGLDDSTQEKLQKELGMMDAVLGILVLKTRYADLIKLDRMAAILEKLGLFLSRGAALFILGYEEAFRAEYKEKDNLDIFFSKWLDQPAEEDLPVNAEWHLGKLVTMHTVIIGCEIELVCENRANSILLGEAILAFLESLFSTLISFRGNFAFRSNIIIKIKESAETNSPISHEVIEDECGETHVVVRHIESALESQNFSEYYQQALFDLLLTIIKELQLQFSEDALKELFDNQKALDRAMLAARSLIAITNMLTFSPKYHVSDWIDEEITESLSLIRTTEWRASENEVSKQEVNDTSTLKYADGPPPEDMFGIDAMKHKDLRVFSPINMPLWDKAQWSGLGFTIRPGNPLTPELLLMFKNYEAGIKIFRGWNKRLGKIDRSEWIGLTIVTGTDKYNPAHYRVAISVNHALMFEETKQAAFVVRMKDMTPNESTNLDLFINLYQKSNCYLLSLGHMVKEKIAPYSGIEFSILKRDIRIVPAWKIGPNDPAIATLNGISDPIIPSEADEPPILKVWEQRKNRSNKIE
jgi:hypothetical protein